VTIELEAQAFLASVPEVDGFDLATLDTVLHGLPGNAQPAHGLIHGEIAFGCLFCDARTQILGEANAPRRMLEVARRVSLLFV
jgi:hypothetical protein